MKITNITQWLLIIVFLVSCTGAVEPQFAVTNVEVVIPTVAAFTAATPPTSMPALNGGGVTNDETTLPVTAMAAAAITAESPTLGASDMPIATTPAPTAAALAATATPTTTIWSTDPHSLQIEVMRQQSYPGSLIIVEQTLEPGANYNRYIVSYQSDGYKIYALMTIPNMAKPATGWPVIVFNHGYIPPSQYRTTERYVAYVDTIARNGYIVFKSDYRGHGSSEGDEVIGGGYGTPAYTADVLNSGGSFRTNSASPQHH